MNFGIKRVTRSMRSFFVVLSKSETDFVIVGFPIITVARILIPAAHQANHVWLMLDRRDTGATSRSKIDRAALA